LTKSNLKGKLFQENGVSKIFILKCQLQYFFIWISKIEQKGKAKTRFSLSEILCHFLILYLFNL